MDITVRTETFGVEDRSWLASAHGTTATRTITIDPSLFTAGTHFAGGKLRSGTVLARVTATGLYGPYDNTKSNGQEVAAGHLFTSVQLRATTDQKAPAALMEHGFIRESRLPSGHGLDAAAKTDLAGKFTYR
ncbi:head decoration protein [Micromonospora maritima]|uniref:head decoration protein n=1 Tax=Micromonospora maritima TaxID=986711 RepID=UPI00157DA1F1|nr:head decoration protein [Micromonospora maritima]